MCHSRETKICVVHKEIYLFSAWSIFENMCIISHSNLYVDPYEANCIKCIECVNIEYTNKVIGYKKYAWLFVIKFRIHQFTATWQTGIAIPINRESRPQPSVNLTREVRLGHPGWPKWGSNLTPSNALSEMLTTAPLGLYAYNGCVNAPKLEHFES
jgi:hypothetical protein